MFFKLRSYNRYLVGLTILLAITAFTIYIYIYNNKNATTEKLFNVSPQNSYEVNTNKLDIHNRIDISRDVYSSALENSFESSDIPLEIQNKIYAQEFTLRDTLEKITKDELNKRFPDSPIEVSEIESVGFIENTETNSVIFNFDINLINRRVMWIIPVKVWIKLDATKICEQTLGCVETVSQLIRQNLTNKNDILGYFNLINVRLDNLKKYTIKPIDSSSPDYFQIKNTLFLTEPFLTSGEEMRLKNVGIQ